MQYPHTLLVALFSICSFNLAFAQPANTAESPVKLEYVVAQQAGSAALGSFVIKNDYLSRDLSAHHMVWDLSFNGEIIHSDIYPLGAIKPSETKYIHLRKLFDLHMLDELGDGLISIYAEVQDRMDTANPIRLVGESAVLAEAEIDKTRPAEQYHVIKVGGARIHRIANGNSLTLDNYNQLSALDLGEGNVLAGPIRPVVYFDSLSAKQPAQRIIDSLGPSNVFVTEDKLSGFIEYDMKHYGVLSLPFKLTGAGFTIGIQLSGYVKAPVHLALEAPLRGLKDSISLIGQEPLVNSATLFGDSRVGLHTMRIIPKPFEFYPFFEVRSLLLNRCELKGDSYTCILSPATQTQQKGTGITHHPLATDTWVLEFGKTIEQPYGSRMNKRISAGDWLFAPVLEKD